MPVTLPKFQVILNGITLDPELYSGTKDSKVVIRVDDQSGGTFGYSNDIQLYGAAKDIIKDNLITSASRYTNAISLIIKDTCCRDDDGDFITIFEGRVTSQDVKFCEDDCFVEVNAEDNSLQAQRTRCVNDTLIISRESLDKTISSQGEDEGRPAVFFRYCIEDRSKILGFLRVFFLISNVVVLVPFIIVIASILVVLTFGAISPADIIEFQNNLIAKLVGCNRKHKSLFIYSYITNVCKLCNLTLSSPNLFDQGAPYHDLTYFFAPFEKGREKIWKAEDVFEEYNFPSTTFTQFMQEFQNLNIAWSIEGSVLNVDRKDRLNNDIWIDFASRQGDIIEQCYQFGDDLPKAGRVYEYTQDASDLGEEANRLWGGKVLDYNVPYNPVLRGVERTIVPFSPGRFIDDTFGSVIGDADLNLPGYNLPDDVLLLATGTATTPKLLMYDTSTDREDARVPYAQDPSSGNKMYNVDGWLRFDINQIISGQGNFYTRLLFIDDPRIASSAAVQRKFLNYELIFTYNCEDLRTFKIGSQLYLYQDGVQKIATIDTVEIDYQKKQIKVNGQI
jgi:hypothetical protein